MSGDGAFVVVGGYANTYTSVDSATGANSPRVVALVKYDGTYTRPFSSTTVLSGNTIRSATSDGFGNFWGNGNSGTIYFNTATTVQSTASRVNAIFDGNLYYTVGGGLYGYSGTPTTAVGAAPQIIANTAMSASASPSSFALPPSPVVGSIAYMVDYNSSASAVGHFHWDGGSWIWDYNVALPGGLKSQHIAVNYANPALPVVYVTPTAASGNTFYYFVDNSATPTVNLLATAPSGQAFRGVAMAPTQPGAPLFTTPPLGQTNVYGATVSFGPVAATGANPNGFTWMRYGTNLIDGPTRPGGPVISGATSNTLTISGIAFDDQTFYYAVAHNNGPSTATSAGAYLKLLGSCISPNLAPQTICAGGTANFSGGTSGCLPPLTIAWTFDNGSGEIPIIDGAGPSGSSTISGATTGNLSIANVQEADAGIYKLTVTNGNGDPSVSARVSDSCADRQASRNSQPTRTKSRDKLRALRSSPAATP